MSKIFDTFRQFFAQGKKRQKVSKIFSTLFDNFRAAPVFRPLLGGADKWRLGSQGLGPHIRFAPQAGEVCFVPHPSWCSLIRGLFVECVRSFPTCKCLEWPHIAPYFFREVSSSPKLCDTSPGQIVPHRHICAIPHLAAYRAIICTTPQKIRKRRGVQKSMGNKVSWKIGVLIYLPVTLRPLISLQEEAVLSPCNFATANLTACILNFYLP